MKIGIYGYGRLGKGIELAAIHTQDVTVSAVFTNRDVSLVSPVSDVPVISAGEWHRFTDCIDVMLLAHGSAKDIPKETPELASLFHTVDAYDCHANIEKYRSETDIVARDTEHTALVSCGWDPGLLSVMRGLAYACLPGATVNTFWGNGVSQGHSEAIRKLPDVWDAVAYTVPDIGAKVLARNGVKLTSQERHRRVCYVVCRQGREATIEREICQMPDYFEGYETEVHFVDEKTFAKEHRVAFHKGEMIAVGNTGVYAENREEMDVTVSLGSNPEFTGAVMVAYARAALRMAGEGKFGAFTAPQVPISYLLPPDVSLFDAWI